MNGLRAGAPITVAGTILIPIAEANLQAVHPRQGWWVYGSLEPVSVVVCGPGGPRAVDTSGRQVDLEQLIGRVPGLAVLLGNLDQCR